MAEIPKISDELLLRAFARPSLGKTVESGVAGLEKGVDIGTKLAEQKAKRKKEEMELMKEIQKLASQQKLIKEAQTPLPTTKKVATGSLIATDNAPKQIVPETALSRGLGTTPVTSPVSEMEDVKLSKNELAQAARDKQQRLLGLATEVSPEERARIELTQKEPKRPQYTKIGETDTEIILADLEDPTKTFRIQAPGLRDKKSDSKSDQAVQAKQSLTGVVKEVGQLFNKLTEKGGIVDTSKGRISNIKARLSATAPAQAISGAAGTEVQSIRNQINMSRPLLINFIRQASQMGARGLDSEKELEFYLQAATDPKKDVQSNIAALARLDQAYGTGEFKAPEEAMRALEQKFQAENQVSTSGTEDLTNISTEELFKRLTKGS